MLQVNGEPLEWREGMTLRDILVAKRYTFPMLVVTLDGTLFLPDAYDSTPVPDGAEVMVMHLMSGG